MLQKHPLIRSAFWLTGAGFLTRIAGFFYKIFLSRTIGAREIGVFQLIMPVYAFFIAACSGGIQTAVSRFTAEYRAKSNLRGARSLLICALLFSCILSCIGALLLFAFAPQIAASFLLEPSCTPLLQIIACSLPFSAVHSCICGYFIGFQETSVPAFSQMLEQLLRISAAVLFFLLFQKNGREMNAAIMALGQIAGELASSLFCMCCFLYKPVQIQPRSSSLLPSAGAECRKILSVSVPLGLNRMLLCVLQGMEAALLPQQLQRFGLNSREALSLYGIMTGMTLPLLLFPTAITGTVSTLLLPAVSEARTRNQGKKITETVYTSFQASLLLGFFFLTVFLLFGKELGFLLFHNVSAGLFLQHLALLCPFLYLNTTLSGILHGLGKTTAVFLWNIAGFLIRLSFVLISVPSSGMKGYLNGMIASQLFVAICTIILLRRLHILTSGICTAFVKAGIASVVGGSSAFFFLTLLPAALDDTLPGLAAAMLLFLCMFLLAARRLKLLPK